MGPRARTLTNHGSDASAEHRRALEALFSGGGSGSLSSIPSVTPMDNQRVFASPRRQVGRKLSDYSMRLNRLRAAREPNDVRDAADAFFKEKHQLPDDMDILLKLLQHPSEKVLCNVMGQISFLLSKRRARVTIILVDRLKEIGSRAISKDTQDCLDGLHQQIKALETV